MAEQKSKISKRILIVDDNPATHTDLKEILGQKGRFTLDNEIYALEEELFANASEKRKRAPKGNLNYELDDAYQGHEAIKMVEQAHAEKNPYSIVFMDVRMPPGIDGIQTIQKIWKKHPYIEMIICTAYSDHTWDQIVEKLGSTDQLLFIKKPFNTISVKQIVLSLTKKWEQRRKKEARLIDLEDDVVKRTGQLNSMIDHFRKYKEEIDATTIVSKNFLSTKSIQMQTPLNSIIGSSEMLLDTELSDEQYKYAEKIKASSDSLVTIVNDILDYSRFEAEKISLDEIEFNLRTTVENVVDLVSVGAHEKGLDIGALIPSHIPENVISDPLRLRQLLLNLLTNAVKFTETGEILVSLSLEEEQVEKDKVAIRFEVSDTGIGISPKDQKEIFVPKSKSIISATQRYGNTGLGLAICKKLALLMKGDIGVESEPGKGSIFWFSAIFEVEESPKVKNMQPSQSLKGLRCLILSHSSTTRKVLTLHIDQWGGKCSEATHLDLAIEMLHTALDNDPFGILVVDDKNATIANHKDIALAIKKFKDLKNLHLICLSSQAKRGDAKILSEIGYSAFLTKPIKQSHLYKALLMIYGLREKRCTLEETGIVTKHFVDEFAPDRFRILVVDDNEINQRSLVFMLNKLRIRSDIAANGKKALDAFNDKTYDLILMDCQMPVMDGFEATRQIRNTADEKKRAIPIIATTGDQMANTREKCTEAGMDDMLAKPIEIQNFIRLLKRYLEKD